MRPAKRREQRRQRRASKWRPAGGLRRRAGQWREWLRLDDAYIASRVGPQVESFVRWSRETDRLIPLCPECRRIAVHCPDPACIEGHHLGFEYDIGRDCPLGWRIPWDDVVLVSPNTFEIGEE
jgi:hypothetical protein